MKCVSILRGINVSGQKKIIMADLKVLYEELGFEQVETYIQSGNVVFESSIVNVIELQALIESAIEAQYGFHVTVLLRTQTELNHVVSACPFGDLNLEEEGTRVLVTFLASQPPVEKVSNIQQYVAEAEKLIIIDREVYMRCPNGYGKTKLSNNFLGNKLGVSATTRNWKTVVKLAELVA